MNNKSKLQPFISALIATLLIAASRLEATPYASGITNNAGTISFILNESADAVNVVFDGGGTGNTNALGALAKGLHSFSLGAHTTWQIHVIKTTPQVWTLISDDSNVPNQFYAPRSTAVNRDPASAFFGRVYVLEHAIGPGAGTTASGRTVTKGMFALNADLSDALGQGNTGLTGGLETYSDGAGNYLFGANSRYEPWKIVVGEDNYLYVSDAQNPRGALARVDGNISNGELVLTGVGNATAPSVHTVVYGIKVTGSLAGGNLSILGTDGQWQSSTACNSVLRWNIGAGPLAYGSAPSLVAAGGLATSEQDSDLDVAPDGNVFVHFFRSTVATAGPSLQVFSPSGTQLYGSVSGGADAFLNTRGLKISPDGTKLALLRNDQRTVIIGLTNGPNGRVPDLSNSNFLATFTSASAHTSRSVDWDIAGNLYVANNNSELLRVWSPGGGKTAITKSDGTFQIVVPQSVVSVTATTPTGNEQGPVNGLFTLTRSGGDSGVPLTVTYTMSGSAANGTDYAVLSGSVTFQSGATSTNITVTVTDDSTPELTETAVLTIDGSLNYGIGTGSATVSILDNETPEIAFRTTATNKLLESYAPSKVTLQLERRGLLTPALTVNLSYSGAATRVADFNGPLTVNLAASAATASITITSTNDHLYEGDELAIVSVASGGGYNIGTPGSGYALVVDDEYPAGAVLFSDDFNGINSSNLWRINLADPNTDHVEFNYDYSAVGIPVAPGTTDGTRLGLRMRCGNDVLQFDGLSLSPTNGNFTGNYRLKFDMWINYNGPMPDGGPGSTQNFDAGVGTTGDHPVWFNNPNSVGLWFTCTGDGADGDVDGDYTAFLADAQYKDDTGFYAAGTGAGPNTGIRNASHPFYSLWGGQAAPADQLALFPGQTGVANAGNAGMAWHTVVITKLADTVKWQIDGVTICTVTNDPVNLSTNVFVGYQDKFASGVVSPVPEMSFGLVDNLRVETYLSAPISITAIAIVGGNIEIRFTGPPELAATAFKLQSSVAVKGTYTDDNSANLTSSGPGSFKATTVLSASRFYRIKL